MSRRLFVGDKEIAFFNTLNKELLQQVVGQKVIYYAISAENTNSHWLYEEAMKKAVYTPVEVNALILYKAPEQSSNNFTIDTTYTMEAYFHINELNERQLNPKVGDYLKWNNMLFEIEKATYPQLTFGQLDHEVMVKTECRIARKSQLEVFDGVPGV